jgi:hypothetical protein
MTRQIRALELKVAEAITSAAAAERARREAEERAARAHDLRGGLLAMHQPRAQHSDDHRVPLLFCTACCLTWPCETLEYVYGFGKYAPPADSEE